MNPGASSAGQPVLPTSDSDKAPDASPPPAGTVSYQEARRREAVARATEAEVDLAERLGQLVTVARLRGLMGARLVPAREVLRSASARLAQLVAAESDPGACAQLIDLEMARVETELCALAADLKNLNPDGGTDVTRH